MLDQNTDRMWYVIGAVLVGAAIIFGMNTLVPEVFGSTGVMFDQLLINVDNKMDPEPIGNLIDLDGDQEIIFDKRINQITGEVMPNEGIGWGRYPDQHSETWYSMVSDIPVRSGNTYRFIAPKGFASAFVAYYDKNGDYIDFEYFSGEPLMYAYTKAPMGATTAYLGGGDPTLRPDRTPRVDDLENWVFEKAINPNVESRNWIDGGSIPDDLQISKYNPDNAFVIESKVRAKTPLGTHNVLQYEIQTDNPRLSLLRVPHVMVEGEDDGKYFTFSFYARTVNEGDVADVRADIADINQGAGHFDVHDQWERYSITAKYDSTRDEKYLNVPYTFVDLAVFTADVPVQFAFWQIDEGKDLTDWVPGN